MKKEDKEILRHLVRKELAVLKQEKINIEFPPLNYIKSEEVYEQELKKLLANLK